MRHIFNRVYMTIDQRIIHDRGVLLDDGIGLVLSVDNIQLPQSDDVIRYEKVKALQNRDDFQAINQMIHSTILGGNGVLIFAKDEKSTSFLLVIAYLMDVVGMTLPDAYMLVVMRYAMMGANLSPLISAYQLRYKPNRELHGNLLSISRTAVSPITSQLYVSGIDALEIPRKPREAGIGAVLRLDNGSDRAYLQWGSQYTLLDMPIRDGQPMQPDMLRKGSGFIHRQIQAGDKVLVHCMAGMSRSVTFALAYLIEHEGMSLPDAYALVVKGRPIAEPHPALIQSLVQTYDLPHRNMWSYGYFDKILALATPIFVER